MIEKGLNQHNFMPGTERYTRPEEVKALNKFLKSVKDTQEEHTKISEDNLMLPGAHETSGQPRVPKIEDLPKGVIGMKEGETIDSLRQEKVTLEATKDRELETTRKDLEDSRENSLEDSLVDLEDSRETKLDESRVSLDAPEDSELSEDQVKLEKGEDQELSEEKITIKGNQDRDLSDLRVTLDGPEDRELDPSLITLEDSRGDLSLTDSPLGIPMGGEGLQTGEIEGLEKVSDGDSQVKLDLQGKGNPDLDKTQLTIDPPKNLDLEKTKHEIDSNEDKELSKTKVTVDAPQTHELDKTKLEIESNQDKPLDTTQVGLDGGKDHELEKTKVTIESNQDKELDKTQIQIETPQDHELERTRHEIESNQDKELETTRHEIDSNQEKNLETTLIQVTRNDPESLENTQVTIESNQDKDLEITRLEITGNQDKDLDNTQIQIEGAQNRELDKTKLTIESNEDKELETTKIEISRNEDKDLETIQVTIERNQDHELDNTQLKIEKPQDQELENTQVTIEYNQDKDLEDFQVKIQSPQEHDLGETKVTIEGNQDKELETTKIEISRNEDKDLEETQLKIEKPQDNDLSDIRLDISGNEERELETTQIQIQSNQDKDLDSTIISGPVENNPGSLDSTLIGGPEENDHELDTTRIDISPAPEDVEGLGEEKVGLTVEGFEEGAGNFSDSLDSTLIEGPQENQIDLDNTIIDLSAPETFEEGQSNSNFKDSLDSTIIEGPETNDRDLDNTQIELKAPEAFEEGSNNSNFSGALDTTIIEGPAENDHELDDTQITLEAPEAYVSGESNSNFSDSLEDTIIEGPETNDRPLDDTIIDLTAPEAFEEGQSNSNFSDSLEDTIIEGPEENEKLLDDTQITLDAPDSFIEGADNSNFSDSLEDLILELEDIKNFEEGQDNSNFSEALDETIIEGPEENQRELDETQIELSDIDDYEEGQDNSNFSEKLDDTLIKAAWNADLSGRTIFDLDKRKENTDYELSQTKLKTDIQKLSDIDDYEEGQDNSNFSEKLDTTKVKRRDDPGISGRTIFDLDKTVEDPEYKLSEAVLKTNSIKTPNAQGTREITSITEDKIDTPHYKLPKIGWGNFWSGDALNPSTYLRWATENTVGRIPLKGAAKATLIDETLAMLVLGREKLEKLAKANRDRLPGGDLGLLSDLANGSLSVKSAAKSVVSAVGGALSKSAVDRSKPLNRPKNSEDKQSQWEAVGQFIYDYDGDKASGGGSGGFLRKVGNSLMGGSNNNVSEKEIRKFSQLVNDKFILTSTNGIDNVGIGQTLQDLVIPKDITTLDGFKESMRSSRYITTPEKFTSTKNSTNYMTLDSNHIWEIIIKPYVGQLNGRRTWLPSFFEMDKSNKKAFNFLTNYSKGWLPVTGFELQDKKLTSKELPLFDGSLSFPMGLEFTNELRVTFADDSLKTLKRYFDLCAKVSAYMSNIHKESEKGYKKPVDKPGSESISNPTVYLEGKVHPGLYKNLSFLITIFILTPQYGTIKKCNLLCVLKDYTIENQGEMDSSPTELSVTFSIVGENPGDGIDFVQEKEFNMSVKTGQTDRTGTSILDNLGSVVDIF